MVETRTKRLLEQQDEEPCDNVSVDTLAGSEDDDLPRDSAGHVVLYETRQPWISSVERLSSNSLCYANFTRRCSVTSTHLKLRERL